MVMMTVEKNHVVMTKPYKMKILIVISLTEKTNGINFFLVYYINFSFNKTIKFY